MNLLNNHTVRLSIIFVLAALQVACFTIVPEPYSDSFFFATNLTYFVLGLLSVDWRQALKNISYVTLPSVILIAVLLLIIAVIKGNLDTVVTALEVSLMTWGLVLVVALPIFLFGFALRCAAIAILRWRS